MVCNATQYDDMMHMYDNMRGGEREDEVYGNCLAGVIWDIQILVLAMDSTVF